MVLKLSAFHSSVRCHAPGNLYCTEVADAIRRCIYFLRSLTEKLDGNFSLFYKAYLALECDIQGSRYRAQAQTCIWGHVQRSSIHSHSPFPPLHPVSHISPPDPLISS